MVIILPTANWLVRALGLPSLCESPSRRLGEQKSVLRETELQSGLNPPDK